MYAINIVNFVFQITTMVNKVNFPITLVHAMKRSSVCVTVSYKYRPGFYPDYPDDHLCQVISQYVPSLGEMLKENPSPHLPS